MKKILKFLKFKKKITRKSLDVNEVRRLGIMTTFNKGVIVVGGLNENLIIGKITGWVPKTTTPIVKDYITGVEVSCYGPMFAYSDETLEAILKLNAGERVLLLNPNRIKTNMGINTSHATKDDYVQALRSGGFFNSIRYTEN